MSEIILTDEALRAIKEQFDENRPDLAPDLRGIGLRDFQPLALQLGTQIDYSYMGMHFRVAPPHIAKGMRRERKIKAVQLVEFTWRGRKDWRAETYWKTIIEHDAYIMDERSIARIVS